MMSSSVVLDTGLRDVPADERYRPDRIRAALERVCRPLGWAGGGSPFGAAIPERARVVVKPNWVMHANKGPWGLEPLITHAALIRQVCEALLDTALSELVLGDAPLQSCDLPRLVSTTGLGGWAAELAGRDPRFRGVVDFRRTRSSLDGGVLVQTEDQVDLSEFVLFDLGRRSLLDPVATADHRFRVTQYRPELMRRTHQPGVHRYLVARSVMEADVVVNLPKLKMHRKAGLTNALKNLIGINGNKEFLPHHRTGGARSGGDCYPGRSGLKRATEVLLDLENSVRTHWVRRAIRLPVRALGGASRLLVDGLGFEGAWSGNDTIWRTCLDLNRVLRYGRADGTMADTPQRIVLHVMDAVVAGQGDGPLAPIPFALGVLGASGDPAALDLAGSMLLGYRPERVPLVREAFGRFDWPITETAPGDVAVIGPDGEPFDLQRLPRPDFFPPGWIDAVEPKGRRAPARGASYRGAGAEIQPVDA